MAFIPSWTHYANALALHLLVTLALALRVDELVFTQRLPDTDTERQQHWRESYGAAVEKRRSVGMEVSFDQGAMRRLHGRYSALHAVAAAAAEGAGGAM